MHLSPKKFTLLKYAWNFAFFISLLTLYIDCLKCTLMWADRHIWSIRFLYFGTKIRKLRLITKILLVNLEYPNTTAAICMAVFHSVKSTASIVGVQGFLVCVYCLRLLFVTTHCEQRDGGGGPLTKPEIRGRWPHTPTSGSGWENFKES